MYNEFVVVVILYDRKYGKYKTKTKHQYNDIGVGCANTYIHIHTHIHMYSMFCNIIKFAELKIINVQKMFKFEQQHRRKVFKEEEKEKHVLYAMKKYATTQVTRHFFLSSVFLCFINKRLFEKFLYNLDTLKMSYIKSGHPSLIITLSLSHSIYLFIYLFTNTQCRHTYTCACSKTIIL